MDDDHRIDVPWPSDKPAAPTTRWRDTHAAALEALMIVSGVVTFYVVLWYLGQLLVFLRGPRAP